MVLGYCCILVTNLCYLPAQTVLINHGQGTGMFCLCGVINMSEYYTTQFAKVEENKKLINITHYTLHTAHYTLHTTHYTLHTQVPSVMTWPVVGSNCSFSKRW